MITKIDPDRCTGCGMCVRSCSLDVFSLDTDQVDIAPCMAACPCGVDIRGVNALLQQDRREEALALVRQAVPFPLFTGLLCAHPCESGCIRHGKDAAVNIRALERFLGEHDTGEFAPARLEHLARVAVVGAGLAGLTCAYFLRDLGYDVTVFEAASGPGGRLRAELPADVVEAQVARLRNFGVRFRYDTLVGPHGDLDCDDLLADFAACCLATGRGPAAAGLAADTGSPPPSVDLKTMQTARERIFAAGTGCGAPDAAMAVAQARRAAVCMDRLLRGADFFSVDRAPRRVATRLPPVLPALPRREDGGQAFDLEAAQVESMRCLTCGSKARITHTDDCMTCFSCELNCPCQAVTVHPFKEALPRTLQIPTKG